MRGCRIFLGVLALCVLLGCTEEPVSIELERSIQAQAVAPSLSIDEATLDRLFPVGSNLFVAFRVPAATRASLAPLLTPLGERFIPHPAFLSALGLEGAQGDVFFAFGGCMGSSPLTTLEAGAYFKSEQLSPEAFITTLRARATALGFTLDHQAPWWVLKAPSTQQALAFAPTGDGALQACLLLGAPQQHHSEASFQPWHEPWFKTLVTTSQARLAMHLRNAGDRLKTWVPHETPFAALLSCCQTLQVEVTLEASTLTLQSVITTASEHEAQALYEGAVFLRGHLLRTLEGETSLGELQQLLKTSRLSVQGSRLFCSSKITVEALGTLLQRWVDATKAPAK